MKNRLIVLFVLLLTTSISSQFDTDKSVTYLKANLNFLASDELEGREITTHGEDLAAMFIATELEKYGIEPFGDSGTYFQKFGVQISSADKNSSISFSRENKTYELFPLVDFLLDKRGFPLEESVSENLEMVFANYGIVADEYGIDDYKDLDVKGKVVVVFDDTPDDDRFTKTDIRKYGTWGGKRKIAKAHGAAAILLILSEDYYDGWDKLARRMFAESFSLESENEESTGLATAAFSKEAFEKLLKKEKHSFEDLMYQKENGKDVEPFQLNARMSYSILETSKVEEAQNVVGVIKGSDPKLSKTFVVVTAHYDHLGVHDGVVYNGADDDGSGTVTILEAARLLSQEKNNKRSILFVFHTGEEKGLLGSKYFTSHSSHIDSIIANINMDMVGREDENEIYCIGSGKLSTEFHDLVEEVNKKTVKFHLDYSFDADDDPNRYYYRSDHYEYAKSGIPVVFFFDEMTDDYHKPSDDVNKISFNKLKKMAVLTSALAQEVSNLKKRLMIDKN